MSATTSRHDAWSAGEHYERYMGRWSRQIAARYLDWLEAPKDAAWLDLGCGTGALTQTILAKAEPRSIVAIDQSANFVAHARAATSDVHVRLRFEVANAEALPLEDASVDVVASALVINFVPDKIAALREMKRVTKPGGLVSFYVWDYPGGGMGFMRAFWNAATALDPNAMDVAEARRFPFCTPEGLAALTHEAGWPETTVTKIEIESRFASFEDYWEPFTLGAGPVSFPARAWAVKARA